MYYQSCSYRAARARHPERTWSPGTPRRNGCDTRETGLYQAKIGIAEIRLLGRLLRGREPEYPVAVGFRDELPYPPGPTQIALCSSGDSKLQEWNQIVGNSVLITSGMCFALTKRLKRCPPVPDAGSGVRNPLSLVFSVEGRGRLQPMQFVPMLRQSAGLSWRPPLGGHSLDGTTASFRRDASFKS